MTILSNKYLFKKIPVMKKIIVIIMLLTLSAASFSQHVIPSHDLTKQDYLQKSKKQNTAAWILLGAGTALLTTGIVIPKGDVTGFSLYPLENTYKNDGVKTAFSLTGFTAMLGSIPLIIASGKNRRKATKLSIRNETAPQFFKQSFVYRPVPSLTIKISL